jgi:hypothetical protein
MVGTASYQDLKSIVISSPNDFSTAPVANVATPISTDIARVIASVVGVTKSVRAVTTITQGSMHMFVGTTTAIPISQAMGSGNSSGKQRFENRVRV